MADDEKPDKDDKTEDPTPKRKQDAKEEGNVPRSQELTSFILLALAGIGGVAVGGWIIERFVGLVHIILKLGGRPTEKEMGQHCLEALAYVAPPMGALFVILVFSIFAGSLSMGGLVLSAKKLKPDASKINPVTNIGQLFSVKGLSQLVKDALKIALLVPIAAFLIMHYRARMTGWLELPPKAGISDMGHVMLYIFGALVIALIVIAAIDVPVQLYSHKKELKMTHKQVKDERKETEGDPHMKGKRKQKMREQAKRSLEAVPRADAVVTNPEHVAVAIRYD